MALMRLPSDLIGIVYDKLFRLRDKTSLRCVSHYINDAFECSDKSLYSRMKQWLGSHMIIREINEVFYGGRISENSIVAHRLCMIEYRHDRWTSDGRQYNRLVVLSAGRQMMICDDSTGLFRVSTQGGAMPHAIRDAYLNAYSRLYTRIPFGI